MKNKHDRVPYRQSHGKISLAWMRGEREHELNNPPLVEEEYLEDEE